MRGEGADATERTETRRNDFCRVLPSSDDCFGISAALRSRAEGAAAPSPSPPAAARTSGRPLGRWVGAWFLTVVTWLYPNSAAAPAAAADV